MERLRKNLFFIGLFLFSNVCMMHVFASVPASHFKYVASAPAQSISAASAASPRSAQTAIPAIVLASGKKVVRKKVDKIKALEDALFSDDEPEKKHETESEKKPEEDNRRVTVNELADVKYNELKNDPVELDEFIGGNGKNRSIKKALQVFKTAAIKDDTTMLGALLDNNYIDLTDQDDHKNTPLHIAADERSSDFVRIICDHKNCALDDIDAKNDCDETPLFVAVSRDAPVTVDILLSSNADTEAHTKKGFTPLIKSVDVNNPEITQLLLDFGADVRKVTSHCDCRTNALQDARLALERNWLFDYDGQSEGQKDAIMNKLFLN